jgi:hypothetical protein
MMLRRRWIYARASIDRRRGGGFLVGGEAVQRRCGWGLARIDLSVRDIYGRMTFLGCGLDPLSRLDLYALSILAQKRHKPHISQTVICELI